jgi:hypothetical protein
MKASQAAAKIRTAIKKTGINPNGMVRVVSNDYITEIEIDLRGVYGEEREDIDDEINKLPYTGEFGIYVI